MKRLVLYFTLLLFVSLNTNSQNPSADTDLRSRITSLMKDAESIGLTLAVVKNNEIVYYDSFGYNPDYNDPGRRKPIDKAGLFRIASVSKTFVATAIFQLVEKGLIDLDRDINDYLDYSIRNPQFPDIPITVRMLLGHRSSITDAKYGTYRNKLDVFFSPNNVDYKAMFLGNKPGTKYNYSNYGYNILGAVIEKASGTRFDDYIDDNIIKPLGLTASYNVSKLDSTKFVWAMNYNESKKAFSKSVNMYNPFTAEMKNYELGKSTAYFSPAGGIKISVLDLAKYMMMHMNYGTYKNVRILSRKSEEMMQIPSTRGSYTALGFYHSRSSGIEGVDLIGHSGGAFGVYSEMFFNLEKKFGFVIICNGCNSGHALGTQVMKELYNVFIK